MFMALSQEEDLFVSLSIVVVNRLRFVFVHFLRLGSFQTSVDFRWYIVCGIIMKCILRPIKFTFNRVRMKLSKVISFKLRNLKTQRIN